MDPTDPSAIVKAMYVAAVVAIVGMVRHAFPRLDGRIAVTFAAVVAGTTISLAQMYLPPRVWSGILMALAAVGGMTALDRLGAAAATTTSSSTTVNVAPTADGNPSSSSSTSTVSKG